MNLSILYMAAGNSRRFGSNKLFYEIDGKPMYLHVLERLIRIAGRHPGWHIFVVTQYQEILEQVARMEGHARRERGEAVFGEKREDGSCRYLHAVFSPRSREGISFTIRAGLKASVEILPDSAGYAFFTADQPYLSLATAERFLNAMEDGLGSQPQPGVMENRSGSQPQKLFGSLCFDGTPGSPTWFPARSLPELLGLTGDTGGRKILKKYADRVRYVEAVRREELLDIDTAAAACGEESE